MTVARDEILKRTRSRSAKNENRHRDMPPPWASRQQFPDLSAQFESALVAAQGEVVRVDSWDGALSALDGILEEMSVRRAVVSAESELADVSWLQRFPKQSWFLIGASDGDLTAFCATADIGISSADAAIAETGSVAVSSGDRTSRLATLLPPVHVVLLPSSRLTADLFTWSSSRQGRLPANLVFVSGPSKTGDIEQTLAVGVHGPGRFIVILYPD